MKKRLALVFLLLFLSIGGLVGVRQTAVATAWTQKVDPWVLETAVAHDQTEFLVYLDEQADVSGAEALPTKLEKGEYVYQQLTAVAQRTQPAVIAALETAGAEFRPYWIANMIWVRGDTAVLQTMARHPDVAHIYANPAVKLDEPAAVDIADLINAAQNVEWNISLVNAPDAWAAGITGQGVVIGGQDTGYDWDHAGLINQYRGWDGTAADHNYNWHDAIHSGGGSCGADSTQPCDDYGHGTHTMGTMVGNDLLPSAPAWPAGAANAVGMAPGARWIGCRNMDVGNGTPATYAECYQWFIAPTDLNNLNPDPTQAPHVINNSWGCPPSEGCTDPNVLLTVVNNVRAAGIVTVHSAGNNGPSCSTITTPAAIYDASFTVGATTSLDTITNFSSRGPVTVDGSNRAKPDISAPGQDIRSTTRNDLYGSSHGTSMAGPHVAGLAALLINAKPALAGAVDTIEAIIQDTAVPLTTTQGCGGDSAADVPNNVYGWGRIDALAAIQSSHTFALQKTAVLTTSRTIMYHLAVHYLHPISVTQNIILTDTLPANTIFITATQPYTFTGSVIQWQAATLAAGNAWEVDFIVQVPITNSALLIENTTYGVKSDEVITATIGTTVTTAIPAVHTIFLPIFLKE